MNMERYGFNYSQDIIDLQTKYSLFKRVVNIVFAVTVESGFDEVLMKNAINKMIERNDCLRLRFVKEGKKTVQFVEPERTIGEIPFKSFSTQGQMDAFLRRFRKKATDMFKGRSLEAVFAADPSGRRMVIFKISHLVADTYGIGVLVTDLFGIYDALKEGKDLPAAPGSFAEVLKKDNEYRANEDAVSRDREFFKEYYEQRHSAAPIYCGLHGDGSDRWVKLKKKGNISLPYLLVKCDTEGYRFVIPSAVANLASAWCGEHSVTMNSFWFYTCAVAASLMNGKAERQIPLELLNCRGSVADRKAAGTKVQSLSVYTIVDWNDSFAANIARMYDEQNELYRHTRLSYLEIEAMQHKLWGHSMLSQLTNFCFSYIPMAMPDGITMQVHSNGKGALPAYIAMMQDLKTGEIQVVYDVQTKMITPAQLVDFQNLWIHVAETVMAKENEKLNDIL